MPTLIDALIVELQLDLSKFTEGQKAAVEAFKKTQEAARKSGAEIEKRASTGADFFAKMRNQALGLFAVLIGGKDLLSFAVDTTNKLGAMSFAAANVGKSVPGFVQMVNVIEQLGGSADAAAQSAYTLSQQLQKARMFGPSRELQVGLSRIGASPFDDIAEIYRKFNKTFGGLTGQGRQEALLFGQQFLGLDIGTLNALLQTQEKYLASLRSAGGQTLPSDRDAENVRNLQQAYTGLRQAIDNAAFAIEGDLAPVLTEIIQDFENVAGSTSKWGESLKTALGYFSSLIFLFNLPGALLFNSLTNKAGEGGKPPTFGQRLKYGYDWLFHGGRSSEEPAAAPSGGQSSRTDTAAGRQAYMYQYLTARGIDPAIARGIVAGATAENSSLDPNATNPTSGAYGIEQVLGPRKKGLFDKYGPKPTLDNELDYLIYDLKGGDRGGASVLGSTSDDTALINYITNFMRPAPGAETAGDLQRGYQALQLIRSANAAAAAAPANVDSSRNNTVTTGDVHIHTPSADPRDHADKFREEIVNQANTGTW